MMELRASDEAQLVIPEERHKLEAAQAILSLFDSRHLSSSSSSTDVKAAGVASPSHQSGNNAKVRVRPCEGCKRRRKKCDAVRPVCSTCLLFNVPCVYSQSANWWYEKAQTKLECASSPCEPCSEQQARCDLTYPTCINCVTNATSCHYPTTPTATNSPGSPPDIALPTPLPPAILSSPAASRPSCSNCRIHNRPCDAARPACTSCVTHGTPGACEYRGRRRKDPGQLSCVRCQRLHLKCDTTRPACVECSRRGPEGAKRCEYGERFEPPVKAGLGSIDVAGPTGVCTTKGVSEDGKQGTRVEVEQRFADMVMSLAVVSTHGLRNGMETKGLCGNEASSNVSINKMQMVVDMGTDGDTNASATTGGVEKSAHADGGGGRKTMRAISSGDSNEEEGSNASDESYRGRLVNPSLTAGGGGSDGNETVSEGGGTNEYDVVISNRVSGCGGSQHRHLQHQLHQHRQQAKHHDAHRVEQDLQHGQFIVSMDTHNPTAPINDNTQHRLQHYHHHHHHYRHHPQGESHHTYLHHSHSISSSQQYMANTSGGPHSHLRPQTAAQPAPTLNHPSPTNSIVSISTATRDTSTTTVPPSGANSRISSCWTCYTKKVKCDRVRPACAFCVARGIACAYPTPISKTAKMTKPPRKRGTGVVPSLRGGDDASASGSGSGSDAVVWGGAGKGSETGIGSDGTLRERSEGSGSGASDTMLPARSEGSGSGSEEMFRRGLFLGESASPRDRGGSGKVEQKPVRGFLATVMDGTESEVGGSRSSGGSGGYVSPSVSYAAVVKGRGMSCGSSASGSGSERC